MMLERRESLHVVPSDGGLSQALSERYPRSTKALAWFLGGERDSCNVVCAAQGRTCSEEALRATTSSTSLQAAASEAGFGNCSDFVVWAGIYPAVDPGSGTCAYHHVGGTISETACDITTFPDDFLHRLCPCVTSTASARGDPHLTNLLGQKFDINREGVSTFLMYPRMLPGDHSKEAQLRVDAQITHPAEGFKCKGWFITKMWVNGSKIGEPIEMSATGIEQNAPDAFQVKIGGRIIKNGTEITRKYYNLTVIDRRDSLKPVHTHNRIGFSQVQLAVGGVRLEFSWFTGKKLPNSLNVNATSLKVLGEDWGGLLGTDDHSWASSWEGDCAHLDTYRRLEQLGTYGYDDWVAAASLD